jgi:flagellar biosynthesis protein FlhA
MDGASKFVRGDAIAGLIILVINLLGGVSIGAFQHGLSLAEAFQRFALLTIGDGLVAQIPSLLLAVAAAIIVTRMNDEGDVSEAVGKQLLASPRVIFTAALIMVTLGIVPGMPTVAFLAFAAPLFYVAWRLQRSLPDNSLIEAEQMTDTILSEQQANLEWGDISHVDKLSVELGFRLVYLADKDKGEELVKTLRGVRKNLSEQLGFLLPEIRIKDNLKLNPQEYKVNLAGVPVASANVNAKELLALNTGDVYGSLDGEITTDPAYGLEAVWIKDDSKTQALNMGYSVVDLGTIIATHTGKVIKEHLDELFSYEDVQKLNERLKEISPSLAETFEKALPTNLQLKVIRLLLKEHISIKDIVTIAGTLIDSVEVTKDPILLVSDVRCALQKVLVKQVMGNRDELSAYSLDEKLESTLQSSLDQAMQAGKVVLDSFAVDPNLLGQFQRTMPLIVEDMKSRGVTPTLIVVPQLRPLLARYAKTFTKGSLVVLSYNEIPDTIRVDILGSLG